MQWAVLPLSRSCNRISLTLEGFHQAVRRITQELSPLSDLSDLLWRRSPSRPARISSLAPGWCHLPQPSIVAAACQIVLATAANLAPGSSWSHTLCGCNQIPTSMVWALHGSSQPSPLVRLSPPRTCVCVCQKPESFRGHSARPKPSGSLSKKSN